MTLTTRPRGTNDIGPGQIELWHKLEEKIRQVTSAYGYQELRTPIFEHTELFQRGIGEATDIVEKEMYTFLDKGKRSLTLRPEGTAPVVRAFVEGKLGAGSLPVKLYYYGPMFRYERPQAGRYRQFTQFGFEVFGSQDPLLDVEAIMLPLELYKSCGLSGFEVQINTIGCPACRPSYRQELVEYFEPQVEKLCASCRDRLHRNPMRLLDCKVESCQEVLSGAPQITRHLCEECAEHFAQVVDYLDALGVDYKLNHRLVRGFDYYTKTVFEVTSSELGAQNAIGAGGRYDGLVEELGGKPTPAVGFAVGVERLLLALQGQDKLKAEAAGPHAYLIHFGGSTKRRAAEVAYFLRSQGLWAELDYLDRSIKAQMKAANRLSSKYAMIFGEEELGRNRVILRNMRDGHEQEMDLQELEQLAKIIGECGQ